jgi:hypothetical protein
MKKQLFICALIFLFAGTIRSYAQMAFTPNYDKLADTTAYPNTINVIGGYIHNNVNTSTSLTMQILNSNLPPGWKISMCVQGNCFPVGYNSHTFIIDPSANAGAEVDFHVGTTYGTGYATFKFTNNSNTADNVILNCSFTMLSPSASVAKAEIAGERTISQNFPNPLVSQTTIDYSLTDNSKAGGSGCNSLLNLSFIN